jgi:hypothetical protein
MEWELLQVIFNAISLLWGRPHLDLFATSLNHYLDTFVSPVPDPLAYAVDAMSISWKGMFAYAFPPFRFLSQVLQKVAWESCKIILIAPAWPKQAWFTDLLRLSCARPLLLPLRVNLLSQLKGRIMHPNPENLHLHTWLLCGRESDRKVFLSEQPSTSPRLSDSLQRLSTMQSGQSSLIGVLDGKLILSKSVQQLAVFFVHLFEDKGLLPSTIKGYRSSITCTLTISGGTDFSNNEFLSLLITNFDLERPKQKRLVPQWDLGLVLSSLKLPPFEPATEVDIKFVSYKYCFLLALVPGRRRSEIHAVSLRFLSSI